MIRSNWKIFEAKFSSNPQSYFEWFCYILFCKEYKKDLGVSGYFNQKHIETNPVVIGKEVVGWQAKYYETPLTSHKSEIIKLIKGSKKSYPELNKIIFYTNKNWSQGKKQNDPKVKIEIETIAKSEGIKIDWEHMGNFFNSPFVAIENEAIAKYFFSLDKSTIDLIEELRLHSENVLAEIYTTINYNNQTLEIDRSSVLDKLQKSAEKVLILSGVGGVGKTAIIKKLYEQLKETIPFYIFKATEFELNNINDLFVNISFLDFLEIYKKEVNKFVVIDSAERLLDLNNTNPFKEFLNALLKDNWRIIFTTRENYLEDLNYQFFEVYKIAPFNLKIQDLEQIELKKLSQNYLFPYPKDERLQKLLQIPFYLNEYLKFCKKDEEINYLAFKERLWNNLIKRSKPAREQCFLKVSVMRAESGQFYVTPDCESQILDNELKKDGILGYESPGYFITHDIYEEWALEKYVEIEFQKKSNNKSFFEKIGNFLPVRRAVRNWISERLLTNDSAIIKFAEETILDSNVEQFWKDEVLKSILLSNYSKFFFDNFKSELLLNDQELLKKLTFLLRIACKEVDDDLLKLIGLDNVNVFSLKYVLTKPKGSGWHNLIKFVYENIEKIGIDKIYFVLPIIHDWNSKYKEGETTKFASLIALQYYKWIVKEDVHFSDNESKNKLLQTIVYGSSEISDELDFIINQIVDNKWKNYQDPYFELSEFILTKFDSVSLYKTLPGDVIKLADLFWTYTPKEDSRYNHFSIERDSVYGIEESHQHYFPPSSFQTPIHWLLQSSLKETIDFILSFTNKSVEYFVKNAPNGVEEVEVILNDNEQIKQYINNGLWCLYRGTQSLPSVLESMYMALEKFFLENGENTEPKTLESWLFYLIKNSRSASMSSVVASIVLAFPEKTFNVAKVLFKTKKFFLYDTTRLVLDQGQKSNLLMLKNLGADYRNEYHQNERIKSCDLKHRTWTLENLFLNYQFFRSKDVSDEEADKRKNDLWKILDDYYKNLPSTSSETDDDKTWRLFLARMDRRKMAPTTEEQDGQTIIKFNPKIGKDLKKFSEAPLKKNALSMKALPLKLWADFKLKKQEEYKQYDKYEKHPEKTLEDIRKIILKIKKGDDESFNLLNYSIPVSVCSVLIRDHMGILSKKNKEFCKKIVLNHARKFLTEGYEYQIGDGTEQAFSVLPNLFAEFTGDRKIIKETLLFGLFNDFPIDMVGSCFNVFSVNAIHKMWTSDFEDSQSLLLGYLVLRPKYETLREKIRVEEYNKGNYQIGDSFLYKEFIKNNKKVIKEFVDNKISTEVINNIEQLDLDILRTAFLLIPLKTTNQKHKDIVNKIIEASFKKLLSNDREDRVGYEVKHNLLEKLAYFLLSTDKNEIKTYLSPILNNFNNSETIADLFEELVSAEDRLGNFENFWEIWELFYDKVIDIGKKGDRYWYTEKIIKSYLFANTTWKETAESWHSLKESNANFFKKITKDIGCNPSVLYSISKLLNDIGCCYVEEGIEWIYLMLKDNANLQKDKLETNTIYYLENIIRKYIYNNREKIKKTTELKVKVLIILEFLTNKGSVIGYILRETVL